ncbi:hypothetical protein FHR33_002996 [Nonomuraea dietziae]|uniref:Uncharacterized protein n=1 Tax=Nonomuraea dietziae TaxID=65515 RepID=A0A7W5V3G8_9ACTN|nr:hypothetical protein [Nonomuraea dietziae]
MTYRALEETRIDPVVPARAAVLGVAVARFVGPA